MGGYSDNSAFWPPLVPKVLFLGLAQRRLCNQVGRVQQELQSEIHAPTLEGTARRRRRPLAMSPPGCNKSCFLDPWARLQLHPFIGYRRFIYVLSHGLH